MIVEPSHQQRLSSRYVRTSRLSSMHVCPDRACWCMRSLSLLNGASSLSDTTVGICGQPYNAAISAISLDSRNSTLSSSSTLSLWSSRGTTRKSPPSPCFCRRRSQLGVVDVSNIPPQMTLEVSLQRTIRRAMLRNNYILYEE